MVLVVAFLLLIGAPAALLYIGRAIVRATDFKARLAAAAVRAAAAESGEAWYFRGKPAGADAAQGEGGAWFERKMRPAFRWRADGEG